MRKLQYQAVIGTVICILALSGCAPGYQPLTSTTTVSTFDVSAPSGWSIIFQSAQKGQSLTMYKVETSVDLIQGSLHTNFTEYGAINPPDRASLDYHAVNSNVQFYQQGLVAYSFDDGFWTQTNTIPNLNVFPSYEELAQQGMRSGWSISSSKKPIYVQDEYCIVYQAIIPANSMNPLPTAGIASNDAAQSGMSGDLQVKFFVGKIDGQLREVQTVSLGGVDNVGSIQVTTDTTLFDLDKKTAKVQVPLTLTKQLENLPS